MPTFPESHFLPSPGPCGGGYFGCRKPSTHHLYAPDGLAVPGCSRCEACATRIVEEYRTKLGEDWRAIPISSTYTAPTPAEQEV